MCKFSVRGVIFEVGNCLAYWGAGPCNNYYSWMGRLGSTSCASCEHQTPTPWASVAGPLAHLPRLSFSVVSHSTQHWDYSWGLQCPFAFFVSPHCSCLYQMHEGHLAQAKCVRTNGQTRKAQHTWGVPPQRLRLPSPLVWGAVHDPTMGHHLSLDM